MHEVSSEPKRFRTLDRVTARNVDYVWGTRLPICHVTLLDGRPGTGKSMLLEYVASRLTAGEALPFDIKARKGPVLLLSVEDPPAEVLRPRMERFGADLRRVRFTDEAFALDEKGLASLEKELRNFEPLLVVIDPLFAYLGEKSDIYRANEVMPFIYGLKELAEEYECAIVGVRHLTKAVQDDILNAGLGSIGFIGAARSGLHLVKHHTEEGVLVLLHPKLNIGPPSDAILYQRKGGGILRPPRLEFLRTEKIDPDEFVRFGSRQVGRPPDQIEEAEAFLKVQLSKGPVVSRDLFARAEAYSFSDKTMRRAFENLRGRVIGHGPGSKWSLPSK